MKIDVTAPLDIPIPAQVAFIQRAEALGFDGVGVADHLEYGRDVFVILALAAHQTQRIVLHTGVTNPVTRHPFHLAGAANSMAEAFPGRFKLGIATGDSAVIHTGRRPASVAEFRQALLDIRTLLHGGRVTFGEQPAEVTGTSRDGSGIRAPAKDPPAIMVTASGARAITVAGELGDEALLLVGLDKRVRARALEHLAAGAALAGRAAAAVPVSWNTLVSLDPDPGVARDRCRPWLAVWLRQGLFAVAEDALGMKLPRYERPQDIPAGVLAQLCDALLIVGTPAQVRERFEQLSAEGVGHVVVMAAGGAAERTRVMEHLAANVLPHVGAGLQGTEHPAGR